MHCAFCNVFLKEDNTKSFEHILPESLGNDRITLPHGLICDKCNNYFLREIEKPLMEFSSIKLVRAYKLVPSKKKKFTNIPVLLCGESILLEYDKNNNCFFIGISPKTIEILKKSVNGRSLKMISPIINENELNNSYIVSRFLCKIFCEFLLLNLNSKYKYKQCINNFLNKSGFRKVFNFVRNGDLNNYFPYSVKKIKELYPLDNDDFVTRMEYYLCKGKLVFKLNLYCLEFELFVSELLDE